MKPGPGLLFLRRFLITDLSSLPVIFQLRSSISLLFLNLGRLYVSRNLPISFRLFSLLVYSLFMVVSYDL